MDQFKFRIVERNGLHFFKDVRFNAPHVNKDSTGAIVEFFEGRNLESLSDDIMDTVLGPVVVLAELKELVAELQTVLCS